MPFYDYYDDLAATGLGRAWALGQARLALRYIRAAHPHGRSLLEIGPGHGNFASVCAKAGYTYAALDINLHLLHALQARSHSGVRALAPLLPVASGSYDIVFASHVIEHSPTYRDASAFLSELARTLATGGVVVLVAPDYLALREDFWNCDYSHGFVTTRRRLRQIMRDCGLELDGDHYTWGPLEGLAGQIAGQTIGSRLAGQIARALPGQLGERLYKARLTFGRSVLIIGRVGGRGENA
ncbi:MAG: class I SAM-dependent methyltransferase [Oscillochloris sp.]|nr:class I SAM-dependent methyltransferase [Oscillochloris sp.]